ncbi:uncharacterized protein LOC117916946 isoform X2 [Vitis riparia]|uniref:uncharacterized protein LOC117916946 isoform X2 n=1 Tax=Vitis riparia TaxID=96939 RepID=UPI00155AFDCC|nr:uncharacterized protein LOC117916946 isoform X2 [Vitis riparia]
MATYSQSLSLFIVFTIAAIHGSADLVLEDGYTVRTVFDGHKLEINPHSILPRYGSSDFIILDSSKSVFYTVTSPLSQESEIKRLSGSSAGFSDGDSASAMFSKPRSFAVDLKGNVYVADQSNGVIRKITNRGVTTTIAGGYAQKTGKVDGPAQNASFSKDFELVFVPEKCAVLVSDRGSQLVRQIDLKVEDCRRSPQSVLGGAFLWVLLGLGVSCLVGFIVGIISRPYVIPHEVFCPLFFSKTWKHCLIHLGKQVLMLCFDIRSVIASSMFYALLRRLISLSLSHLSLMFRINILESQFSRKESVSLLDSDDSCISEPTIPHTSSKIFMQKKSHRFADQLEDLMTFNGSSELSNATDRIFKEGDDDQGKRDISPETCGRIESMIEANFMGFVEQAKVTTPVELCSSGNTGLVKRR